MKYALLYIHKVSDTRGIVEIYADEATAMTAAADQALSRPDLNFFVCPMQTQVAGNIKVETKVMAATVDAPASPATPTSKLV